MIIILNLCAQNTVIVHLGFKMEVKAQLSDPTTQYVTV